MLDISIRQLESFAATAEYSSFTRAAQELHLTQSTVSMHIQSLEDILGTQLIVRGARKRFSLTEDGKRVYAAAKDILSRCEALQQMRQGLESEALSIGTSTVPAQHLLPSLMFSEAAGAGRPGIGTAERTHYRAGRKLRHPACCR